MKATISLLIIVLFSACGTRQSGAERQVAGTGDSDSSAVSGTDTNSAPPTSESDYATYFILIADTGISYYALHEKMFTLNKELNIPIDTMERTYNPDKDLIALPENSEDEGYAGDYFPRRFPSENMSLEYLDFYQKETGNKTIALVAGIYESGRSADSALAILQKSEKKAFRIMAEIYVGCMH
jgi:hypothetical protein